jgi:hypothetical protein
MLRADRLFLRSKGHIGANLRTEIAVTSDMIYRAVLDGGVSSVDDFERFIRKMALREDKGSF